MPKHGTSALPVTVFHGVSRAEGPWRQTSKITKSALPSTRSWWGAYTELTPAHFRCIIELKKRINE